MMDEETKQKVRDNLNKMKEKWEKMEEMKKERMDESKMSEMTEKAIKIADDMGMDAKDTMMLGIVLKKVGMAMMKDDETKDWC